MGILGITNRSENWKTAQCFAPFFKNKLARTALVEQLIYPEDVTDGEIQIELYWYGMRDYISQLDKMDQPTREDLIDRYRHLFPKLREQIEEFGHETRGCSKLKSGHYNVLLEGRGKDLYSNLIHTEIDVVLQTPKYLFIGEAKHETTAFDQKGSFLMHQLAREYVMATTLIGYREPRKIVVPFVVGDYREKLRKSYPQQQHINQVEFMIQQHNCNRSPGDWLREGNVLSWECIRQITNPESTHDCSRLTCKEG